MDGYSKNQEGKLNEVQIQNFVSKGYIRLDNVFSKEIAEECREILWADTGCDPRDPTTWTKPVIRLGDYSHPPFDTAVNMPLLHSAFDQLIGKDKWEKRHSLGTFPVRFPSTKEAGDTGWHVEASFPGDDTGNFLSWRINVQSNGRALLMLFIFSTISEEDAPTRIRESSHLDVANILYPAGEKGMSFLELAERLTLTEGRKQVLATGKPGTVYLCHPFLVHAAQQHHGKNPRFMAQPPLYPTKAFQLSHQEGNYSPVELGIRLGIGLKDT